MKRRVVIGVGGIAACALVVVLIFAMKSKEDGPLEKNDLILQAIVPSARKDDEFQRDAWPSASRSSDALTQTPVTSRPVKPSDGGTKPQPTFIRAEDAGEDFSRLPTEEVVDRLSRTTDRIERLKAAKVLGDRDIADQLTLLPAQRKVLDQYIERLIEAADAATPFERMEASDQIERLWRLASDKFIDALGSDNLRVFEGAAKSLIAMRSAEIVKKIIARTEASQDVTFRKNAIFTLGMMKAKGECLVPGRDYLGDAESEAIASKIIVPFLNKCKNAEKDPEILQIIETAFQNLKNPFDGRTRPADQETIDQMNRLRNMPVEADELP